MKNKIFIFAVMAVLILGITSAQAFIPPRPTGGSNTTFCDWINHTWTAGTPGNVTDKYNFTWDTDSDGSFSWGNISNNYYKYFIGAGHKNMTAYVYAYNTTGNGNLSILNLSLGYSVTNCPINISGCIDITREFCGNANIDIDYTDGDNDSATFDTSATYGSINAATGLYTWHPTNVSDVGTHIWNYNVTDGYNVAQCNSTIRIIMPSSTSRGAPALTPIAILGGLALWSTIIVLASRRKRKVN